MPNRPFLLKQAGVYGHQNGVYPASLAEPISWSTATDWDNAISQTSVSHSGSLLSLDSGAYAESFESGDSGNLITNSSSQININSGSGIYYGNYDAYIGGGDKWWLRHDTGPIQYTGKFGFAYREDSNNTRVIMTAMDSNKNRLFSFGPDNPAANFWDDNGCHTLIDSPDPSYNEWREFIVDDWDWENRTATITWNDLTGNSASQSKTINFRSQANSEYYEFAIYNYSGGNRYEFGNGTACWGGNDSSLAVDRFLGPWGSGSGSLTTGTKSFSSPQEPNLTYQGSLSSGTMSVQVIGSPGTASEEGHTVDLGSSSGPYEVNWSSGHLDYRVSISMQSSQDGSSPSMDSVTLRPA